MNRPLRLTDAEIVFPTNVIGTLLPSFEDIPTEFLQHWATGRISWCRLASDWFYSGIDADRLIAKPGIDRRHALRHLSAVLRSWQPQHEHKIAGVAYLMSQWFDLAEEGGRG